MRQVQVPFSQKAIRRVLPVACLAILGVTTAACGSSVKPATTNTPSAVTTPAAASTPAAATTPAAVTTPAAATTAAPQAGGAGF
jgi:hypothetical protein